MPMDITCNGHWLVADLRRPHAVLSWSVNMPGFATARYVVWRGVRNADLPVDLDAVAWLKQQMADAGHAGAVGLMTSRDVGRHHFHEATVEGETVGCLVTAGLSNAERVGRRQGLKPPVAGTINLLVQTGSTLSQAAMLEALSIAVEARTLAVLEAAVATGPDRAAATGTGTDCVVVAAPVASADGPQQAYAGLHTALGEALGAAVLAAMRAAVSEWTKEYRAGLIFAAQ